MIQTESVETTGTILTILGTLITFGAYFSEHRHFRLSELEPRLAALLAAVWNGLRRLLRRPQDVQIEVGGADAGISVGAPSASTQYPIRPDDSLEEQVRRTIQNVDWLRTEVVELRANMQASVAEVRRRATEGITDVRADIAAREQADRVAESEAARWEIRGLLLVLLGTVLSNLG